jgi:hypothetical protein
MRENTTTPLDENIFASYGGDPWPGTSWVSPSLFFFFINFYLKRATIVILGITHDSFFFGFNKKSQWRTLQIFKSTLENFANWITVLGR